MRVLSEILKDHHMSLGTYGTAEALAKRKRICTALGLLSMQQHHLVTSVSERLPVLKVQSMQSSRGGDADDENDDRIFITPISSTRALSKGDWEISNELLRASCTSKRKRTSSSQHASKEHYNELFLERKSKLDVLTKRKTKHVVVVFFFQSKANKVVHVIDAI